MANATTPVSGVSIPSFDSLLERLGDEKKMAQAKRQTLKIKKEARLSAAVKTAQIAVIEATSRLEDALLSESADEASAVKAVIDAQKTADFYQQVYSALFPNS